MKEDAIEIMMGNYQQGERATWPKMGDAAEAVMDVNPQQNVRAWALENFVGLKPELAEAKTSMAKGTAGDGCAP